MVTVGNITIRIGTSERLGEKKITMILLGNLAEACSEWKTQDYQSQV